jgi:ferredoxin-type protein NapF
LAQAINRRQFIKGDLQGRRAALRPPWSLTDSAFVQRCDACGDCISACPEAILVADNAGLPQVDFMSGECSFCEACLQACQTGALQAGDPAWQLKPFISDACLARRGIVCSVCAEQCEHRAIRFRPTVNTAAQPEVEESLCSGCGACVKPCPVACISIIQQ